MSTFTSEPPAYLHKGSIVTLLLHPIAPLIYDVSTPCYQRSQHGPCYQFSTKGLKRCNCQLSDRSPDANVWMHLVYFWYWTLNLMPLMVYPKVLFPPNFSSKGQECIALHGAGFARSTHRCWMCPPSRVLWTR